MTNDQRLKTILKFDVGADGFKKMVYVLAASALLVLIIGIYFINIVLKETRHMS